MATYDALTSVEKQQILRLMGEGLTNASQIARQIGRSRGAVSNFARQIGRPLQPRFPCKVCLHEQAGAIADAIRSGVPYPILGAEFGLGKDQIRMHATKCLGVYRRYRGCSVCAHPDRDRVDAEILAAIPASVTSEWSGLGEGSLHRHGRNCVVRPKGKPVTCKICNHPEYELIEQALTSGTMRVVVAAMFDLPHTSVRYHWERHTRDPAFHARRAVAEVERLAATVRRFR